MGVNLGCGLRVCNGVGSSLSVNEPSLNLTLISFRELVLITGLAGVRKLVGISPFANGSDNNCSELFDLTVTVGSGEPDCELLCQAAVSVVAVPTPPCRTFSTSEWSLRTSSIPLP